MAAGMSQVTAEILAGTCGGILGAYAGHPFDTAKTRLQAMPSMHSVGMTACIRRTVQEEGFLALYKGVLSPVAFSGILNAIVFATEKSSARLLEQTSTPKETIPFLAGCFGGFVQCPVLCLMDAAKINLQVDGGRQGAGTYISVFRHRIQSLGFGKAFFPGLNVTVLREVPSYGVYFLVYDNTKEYLSKHLQESSAVLLAGGAAGVIALAPFHPVDTVKTRLQSTTDPSATAFSVAKTGWQAEGMRFFFRGFVPFVLRTFVLNAATFYGFEEALRRLGPPNS
eukprot:TRINITY_DN87807_c0_g1_i1.p1 TRINITY_DN87807_c0_g1~~TRINITY_DN87807_c0_g1_i1.p1  ORF type:complete len:282 (-),score=42.78 TRINITY_DN87807_c0_g1_i1:8-853(-)